MKIKVIDLERFYCKVDLSFLSKVDIILCVKFFKCSDKTISVSVIWELMTAKNRH